MSGFLGAFGILGSSKYGNKNGTEMFASLEEKWDRLSQLKENVIFVRFVHTTCI